MERNLLCKIIIDNNNNIIVVSPRHNFETEFELTTQHLDNIMLLKKYADRDNNELAYIYIYTSTYKDNRDVNV